MDGVFLPAPLGREHIRRDGGVNAMRWLLWSAIAAGLFYGGITLAKGTFHVQLEGVPAALLENLGYLVYRCHHDPPAIIY